MIFFIRVWDLRSDKPACEVWVNSHGSVIASLAFHPTDHLILIATLNELHFWDWSQSNLPFLTLATSSDKEKVRYVKFDALGTKIVTGISNLPPVRSGPSPLSSATGFAPIGSGLRTQREIISVEPDIIVPEAHAVHHVIPHQQTVPAGLSSSNPITIGAQMRERRHTLLNRVMTMYRNFDGFDATASDSANSPLLTGNDPLLSSTAASTATTAPWMYVNPLRGMGHEPLPPIIEPIETIANTAAMSSSASDSTSSSSASAPRGLSTPLFPPRNRNPTSSNPAVDYSNSLMNTFRRLHSLCTRLAQLMQEQQSNSRLSLEGSRDVRSTENSASLNDLLSRLQQSLQNMSTAALTTAIAQEHIQQVRQRVSEILERLENVSGYRQRLSSLRDQIYEVAERIAAGSEPEMMGGSQRWDLIHCLWLVDMSIHLTRQMQRILAADYRLTQITLNNAQPSNSTMREPEIVTESNRPSPDDDWRPPPTSLTLPPAALRGMSRGRYHPYTRWMLRNRSASSSSGSESSDSNGSFSIPSVRISAPDDISPSDEAPEHVFIRESLAQNRPRSPPLSEIQSVIHGASSSAASAVSRVQLDMTMPVDCASAHAPPVQDVRSCGILRDSTILTLR